MNAPTPNRSGILDRIRAELQRELQPEYLDIVDDGARHVGHANAGSGHFTVTISAGAFAGQSRLQRHRMVFAALSRLMSNEIHALSIKARAPGESVSV